MDSKKNVSLIVGIAIPILMIFLVAISIYLPALLAPAPRFNFLYVIDDNHPQGCQYVMENSVLKKREIKHPQDYTPEVARLFVHDVSADESKEISFEEAQKLKLDANAKSLDGYEVVYGNADDGLFPLFFSGGYDDYNTMYLKGHNASKKLNLQHSINDYYRYRNGARFLGWVR